MHKYITMVHDWRRHRLRCAKKEALSSRRIHIGKLYISVTSCCEPATGKLKTVERYTANCRNRVYGIGSFMCRLSLCRAKANVFYSQISFAVRAQSLTPFVTIVREAFAMIFSKSWTSIEAGSVARKLAIESLLLAQKWSRVLRCIFVGSWRVTEWALTHTSWDCDIYLTCRAVTETDPCYSFGITCVPCDLWFVIWVNSAIEEGTLVASDKAMSDINFSSTIDVFLSSHDPSATVPNKYCAKLPTNANKAHGCRFRSKEVSEMSGVREYIRCNISHIDNCIVKTKFFVPFAISRSLKQSESHGRDAFSTVTFNCSAFGSSMRTMCTS